MVEKADASNPLPNNVQELEPDASRHDALRILAHLIAHRHMAKRAVSGSTPSASNQSTSPSIQNLTKTRKTRKRTYQTDKI
jgi:hypothetical protein